MKGKGTKAERELLHMFWRNNWACTRCAGSGSMQYDSPDLIAGHGEKKICIECKSTSSNIQYFSKEEIFSLRSFCHLFGAEPYVGVRFDNKPWVFCRINKLKETKRFFCLSEDRDTKSFEELISD